MAPRTARPPRRGSRATLALLTLAMVLGGPVSAHAAAGGPVKLTCAGEIQASFFPGLTTTIRPAFVSGLGSLACRGKPNDSPVFTGNVYVFAGDDESNVSCAAGTFDGVLDLALVSLDGDRLNSYSRLQATWNRALFDARVHHDGFPPEAQLEFNASSGSMAGAFVPLLSSLCAVPKSSASGATIPFTLTVTTTTGATQS